MFFVYILYSARLDKYYIGRTENVELRLALHNNPIEGRKFTARGIPWTLQLSVPCETKEQSIRLEKLIKKKKSRKFIESLLADRSNVATFIEKFLAPDC